MKLVLGTANLNQKYGILGETTSQKESIKILKYTVDNLKFVDTASAYDGFNKLTKKINLPKIKINTKISKVKGSTFEKIYQNISKDLNFFLNFYKIKKINTLFLHRPNEILNKKRGSYLIKALKKLKKEKIINYIGYSVYEVDEIRVLINKFEPDIIQGPISFFDQRMIKSGILKILKKKKIKFQARSIFLQGILLNKDIINDYKFFKDNYAFTKWFNWLKKNNLDPANVLIQFIKSHKSYIDSVIFSAKKLSQLKQCHKYFKKYNRVTFPKINKISDNILDPRKWKNN